MLAQFCKATPLIFFSYCLITTGVFFISGRLFPAQLGNVYAAVGTVGRTVIATMLFFPLANFMVGYAMGRFDPALVSPIMIAVTVLVQIVFTVFIMGAKPSLWIIPATLIVMAGCVWVSVLLDVQIKSPKP